MQTETGSSTLHSILTYVILFHLAAFVLFLVFYCKDLYHPPLHPIQKAALHKKESKKNK